MKAAGAMRTHADAVRAMAGLERNMRHCDTAKMAAACISVEPRDSELVLITRGAFCDAASV